MAGRIIFTPGDTHKCNPPLSVGNYRPSTQWQCDCGQVWVLVSGQGEDGQGYSAWRELTVYNRDGQDKFAGDL